ncbi:hypothetical protein lerEdw1_013494 [Lerista edwardsae]|nr:hypothetical protein lerEdw1_013494 [Lerista edwardsae]
MRGASRGDHAQCLAAGQFCRQLPPNYPGAHGRTLGAEHSPFAGAFCHLRLRPAALHVGWRGAHPCLERHAGGMEHGQGETGATA